MMQQERPIIPGVKLFVGNLPPGTPEEALRDAFSLYGDLNGIVMLKGGKSKSGMSCGFVFYKTRDQAQSALEALNGIHTFDGGSEPIMVSFARDGIKGEGKGGKGKSHETYHHPMGKGAGPMAPNYGARMPMPPSFPAVGGYGMMGYPPMMHAQQHPPSYPPMIGGFGAGPLTPPMGGKPSRGGGKHGGGGGGGGGGNGEGVKLFVGNLPPDIEEAALHTVFGAYGSVKTVFVMRTGSVSGQACAFVEYRTEFEAQTAINTLHNRYEIRSGEGPISVRKAQPKPPRAGPY